MTRLKWDDLNERSYEFGIDRGVLYLSDHHGVVWNGLTSVEKKLSGEQSVSYLNGQKILNRLHPDDLFLTIDCFTYPVELDDNRSFSGMSYRTKLGSDKYKIDILYNPSFKVDAKNYTTLGSDQNILDFTFNATTRVEKIRSFAPSAHLSIYSDLQQNPLFFTFMEEILYGNNSNDPHLPTIDEFILIFKEIEVTGTLLVVDYGDGTWLCAGSDDLVYMTSPTEFVINSPGVTFADAEHYILTSY